MKILLISILFTQLASAALSYGDASDGNCDWSSGGPVTVSQSVWNCQDITIAFGTTVEFTGSSTVELRAQGTVTIDGDIDISASGAAPGPGGNTGGTPSGLDGGGPAGGSGGANNTVFGDGDGGTGGGENNSTSDFQNQVLGGAGGGSGGSGFNGATSADGGAGGNGGGAIIIVAKEALSFTGTIQAVGSNGGDGLSNGAFGGGGGGGAGGAIYLVSAVSLDFSGTITANGGTPGLNGAVLATAGAGGRVRLDSPGLTGSIPGGVDTSQPFPEIIDPLSIAATNLKSDIEYACSYKEGLDFEPQLLLFVFGFLFVSFMARVVRLR